MRVAFSIAFGGTRKNEKKGGGPASTVEIFPKKRLMDKEGGKRKGGKERGGRKPAKVMYGLLILISFFP